MMIQVIVPALEPLFCSGGEFDCSLVLKKVPQYLQTMSPSLIFSLHFEQNFTICITRNLMGFC